MTFTSQKQKQKPADEVVQSLTSVFEYGGYSFETHAAEQKDFDVGCKLEKDGVSYQFNLAAKSNGFIERLFQLGRIQVTIDDEVYNNPLEFRFGAFKKEHDSNQVITDTAEIAKTIIGRFKHLDMR